MKIFTRFFLFLLLCSAFAGNATHLRGGYISWECQGNGQYVFTLDLVRETAGNQASLPSSTNISGPVSIPVSRTTIDGDTCGDYEVHHYQSQPINLTGAPPAAGWTFSWNICCRPGTVVSGQANTSIFLYSKMYNSPSGCHSAPQMNEFQGLLLDGANVLNASATAGQPGDSLFYSLVAAQDGNNSSVIYSSGYSFDNPFPNSNQDALNADAALDSSNGLIYYGINSAIFGGYVLAVEVQCWNGGQLVSENYLDNTLFFKGSRSGSPPTAFIDTAIYQNISRVDSSSYQTTAFVGDTVRFDVSAFDFDLTSSGQPQSITFSGSGAALNTPFGGGVYNVNASVSPVSPQAGFTSALNNKVKFEWAVGTEHLAGNGSHHFVFSYDDNACGRSYLAVKVQVKLAADIGLDTTYVCLGDTTPLFGATASGSFLWSPNVAISGTTDSVPRVFPTSDQLYYLEDPQNPGQKDSVWVIVQPPAFFQLDTVDGSLVLTDSTTGSNLTFWYFNGVQFAHPFDTLVPFAPGQYWVEKFTLGCTYQSDTFTVNPDGSFAMVHPGNGNLGGVLTMNQTALAVQFSLDAGAAGELEQITIPGILDFPGKLPADRLRVKIYDAANTEIWSLDTLVTGVRYALFEIPVNGISLAADADYHLVVEGDSGFAMFFYDNVQTPATPWNNGLTIKSLGSGDMDLFPAFTPSDKLLPITFQVKNTIGLESFSAGRFEIFPNPAKESFTIKNLKLGGEIQLLDLNGKILKEQEILGSQITLSRDGLPSGMYLLRYNLDSNSTVQKIIFE